MTPSPPDQPLGSYKPVYARFYYWIYLFSTYSSSCDTFLNAVKANGNEAVPSLARSTTGQGEPFVQMLICVSIATYNH